MRKLYDTSCAQSVRPGEVEVKSKPTRRSTPPVGVITSATAVLQRGEGAVRACHCVCVFVCLCVCVCVCVCVCHGLAQGKALAVR